MITLTPTTTHGEKYGHACQITDPTDAREYFDACVDHQMSFQKCSSRADAAAIERANIGYWAGYYDQQTFDRVMALYGVSHPVFGKSYPTPQSAFPAGIPAR